MDRKIEKKRWTPKKLASIAGGVLIGVFIIYQLGFSDKSSRLNVERQRLVISTVKRGDFQEFIPVIGTVIPIKTIYLDAIEGGSVEHLFLEAGSYVNKGDPILRLANTNLLLDIMYREHWRILKKSGKNMLLINRSSISFWMRILTSFT